MARGQSHFVQISGIPGTHDNSAIIWSIFNFVDYIHKLINALTGVVSFGVNIFSAKMSPLKAINRP
jgi:hypothetical protein